MHAPRGLFGLLAATGAWTLLGVGAAYAPGSIMLDEVLEQLKAETKLVAEIETELKAQGLKAASVICVGARFGGNWVNLGGARAVPYECEIGKRKLNIDGELHLYDRDGKEVDMNDDAAPEQAVRYTETGLKWQWQ